MTREQDRGFCGSMLSQDSSAHVRRRGWSASGLSRDAVRMLLKVQLLRVRICSPFQVCHLHGPKNWCKSVCPSWRPGWSESQNGHDGVCLPYGERNEEGVRPRTASQKVTQSTLRISTGCSHDKKDIQAIPKPRNHGDVICDSGKSIFVRPSSFYYP